jgi:hypothetical protein
MLHRIINHRGSSVREYRVGNIRAHKIHIEDGGIVTERPGREGFESRGREDGE